MRPSTAVSKTLRRVTLGIAVALFTVGVIEGFTLDAASITGSFLVGLLGRCYPNGWPIPLAWTEIWTHNSIVIGEQLFYGAIGFGLISLAPVWSNGVISAGSAHSLAAAAGVSTSPLIVGLTLPHGVIEYPIFIFGGYISILRSVQVLKSGRGRRAATVWAGLKSAAREWVILSILLLPAAMLEVSPIHHAWERIMARKLRLEWSGDVQRKVTIHESVSGQKPIKTGWCELRIPDAYIKISSRELPSGGVVETWRSADHPQRRLVVQTPIPRSVLGFWDPLYRALQIRMAGRVFEADLSARRVRSELCPTQNPLILHYAVFSGRTGPRRVMVGQAFVGDSSYFGSIGLMTDAADWKHAIGEWSGIINSVLIQSGPHFGFSPPSPTTATAVCARSPTAARRSSPPPTTRPTGCGCPLGGAQPAAAPRPISMAPPAAIATTATSGCCTSGRATTTRTPGGSPRRTRTWGRSLTRRA